MPEAVAEDLEKLTDSELESVERFVAWLDSRPQDKSDEVGDLLELGVV